MRFKLSDEQAALGQATSDLLKDYTGSVYAHALDEEPIFDLKGWQRAAQEIGLTGIAVPEESGGSGGDLVDLAVVMEEAGRALTTLPLWSTATAGRALQSLTQSASSSDLLNRLVQGDLVLTVGGLAPPTSLKATSRSDCWVVSGQVDHVVSGPWLSDLLVVAQTSDGPRLLLVDTTAAGVHVTNERTLDPTRALATIAFHDAPARNLSTPNASASALTRVAAESSVLLVAEQVGVAQCALDMAVEYAKTRYQFGRAIGSFQAIKHLLADLYVDVQTARDVMRYAAWALNTDLSNEQADLLARTTRAVVTPRVSRVAAGNLQVHGGIGYTWEHPAHLYYKRALTSSHLLGEVDAELDLIADVICADD